MFFQTAPHSLPPIFSHKNFCYMQKTYFQRIATGERQRLFLRHPEARNCTQLGQTSLY